MRRLLVPILLLTSALGGCLPSHSFGPKNLQVEQAVEQAPLERNKKIYVAMTGSVPENMDGTPEALTLQFAKFLAPVAASVHPAERLEEREEALRNAVAHSCDYVFLLRVEKWNTALLLRPIRAFVDVETLDSASGAALSHSRLEATCSAMIVGLEPSPRECIRPQISQWLNGLFQPGASAQVPAYPNVMPPPPPRYGRP